MSDKADDLVDALNGDIQKVAREGDKQMSDDYDNTLAGSAAKLVDALHAVTVAPLQEFATTYLEAMIGNYGALWLVLSWGLFMGASWVLIFGMLSAIVGVLL